jgi:hypothetical protein
MTTFSLSSPGEERALLFESIDDADRKNDFTLSLSLMNALFGETITESGDYCNRRDHKLLFHQRGRVREAQTGHHVAESLQRRFENRGPGNF